MEKIADFWNDNKSKIIASILFLLFCIMIFWGVYFFNTINAKADSLGDSDIITDNISNSNKNIDNSNIVKTLESNLKVDIKGYVNKPGVYEFSSENRVIDVINKAGGLKDGADTTSINLSKKIFDEMVIVIYSQNEVKNISETRKQEENKINDCENNNNKIINDACVDTNNSKSNSNKSNVDSKNTNDKKININTASLDELQKINGVGESKARSIIEHRSENGPFKNIEEILNVKGIGNALFEKIKNNITI